MATKKNHFKIINSCLFLVALAFAGYLAWDTRHTEPYIYRIPASPHLNKIKKDTTKERPKLAPLSSYLDKIKKRNIFLPINVVIKPVVEKKPETPKIPISQLIKDIKIVGFSFGDPLMVMIKSTKNGNTFFLSAGDSITNKLTIKSITEEGVIVTNGDEDMRLP